MILFLDIENTLIDNLSNRNWLEHNCVKIKQFIENHQIELVHIYTWGWKTPNEVDKNLIDEIYTILNVKTENRGWCLTKENAVDFSIVCGHIKEEDKSIAMSPGMMKEKFALDKTIIFLLMTKHYREEGQKVVLIDDTTETNFDSYKNTITINPIDL